jgi:hypothetical protein
MAITATMVRELRDMTGAAMMDCKKALEASGGDMQAAIDHLSYHHRIHCFPCRYPGLSRNAWNGHVCNTSSC